jgi:ABC-type sugar transport system substrate-binding protein
VKKILTALALAAAMVATVPAQAQTSREQQRRRAAESIDTARFKKPPPYTIGVSAGYLSNSWVVFALQHIKYEASLHKEVKDIVVTDAGFKPAKQVADIEDLINKKVSLIIYWPVDNKALSAVLQKAVDAGIPTVNAGGGFYDGPGTVTNAYISQFDLGEQTARQLAKDMGGKGRIFAMLPIAGHSATVDQLAALKAVLKDYPGIELLATEHGDWNRAKAKQITENLLQRFPKIDGVFSPSGQMSAGVVEAFDEAGRLKDVVLSPADEYNGWLKLVAKTRKGGIITFPTRVGRDAVQLGLAALRGDAVSRGRQVPSELIAAADVGQYVQAGKPDDVWANDLPPEWQPK